MTKPPAPSRAGSLPLVGGVLALDFCNTTSGRGTDGRLEHLQAAEHVLMWARHAGVLDADAEARLRRRCGADARLGKRLLERALDLRDAIYRADAALANGQPVDQADLDAIATAHASCLAKGRLTTKDGGFGWTWNAQDTPEEAVLGPIAASAMMVLAAADRARLKQCPGHQCGWLFLDTTKASNRRWCEMEVCGNRAKQKRRRGRKEG
jgi:predicted RNA-binding Zn ribbon-like protein